jgi:sugar phosphate isomerase/epimerase
MSRDDTIAMAREAGFVYWEYFTVDYQKKIERFAALVAAAEREACAKVCDEAGVEPTSMYPSSQAKQLADAIRARNRNDRPRTT